MPVRLEPAASRSQAKHSTTEPLHSLNGNMQMTKSMQNYPECKEIDKVFNPYAV